MTTRIAPWGAAAALAALAAALLVMGIGSLLASLVEGDRHRSGESTGGERRRHGARGLRLLAAVGARLASSARARAPAGLEERIVAAGRPGGLGAREVTAAKIAATVAGTGVAVALSAIAPGRLGFVLMLAGPVIGFMAPDLWLARRAAERARSARRELPALLDLLRVTVDAGSSLPAAFAAVGERSRGPLGREWRVVARQVALGVPMAAALEQMASRLPLPETRALVSVLRRATRHGAPLAETLANQAREARHAQARRIQEEAARAGPKIQLVVALLLVPSVLLLVAAALAAALLDGGGALRLT